MCTKKYFYLQVGSEHARVQRCKSLKQVVQYQQLNGKSCHVKGTGGDENEMSLSSISQEINFVSSLFLKQMKQNANVKYSCQNDKITVYCMIRD
jgi:hypothetical protein